MMVRVPAEILTVPIVELAEISAEFEIPMHSDAVQAVAQLPVDFAASKLSALSIAAHKFGGPHGVGALLIDAAVGVLTQVRNRIQRRVENIVDSVAVCPLLERVAA